MNETKKSHKLNQTTETETTPPLDLEQSRAYCRNLARSHYENFTLGSFLLPRPLRQHIYNVYAYCRLADDFADEEESPEASLEKLNQWEERLTACYGGVFLHPVFRALTETIQKFDIPQEPFQDLLIAFRQDQQVTRYNTFEDLLGYCENSANPVGRIYLYLFHAIGNEEFACSDAICTALQLANFWQDVGRDYRKGRIYIPLEDLERFGCEERDLKKVQADDAFRRLIDFQVGRTQEFFDSGKRLLSLVPKSARIEIELFIRGGEAVLQAIRDQDCDVLLRRPYLGSWTKVRLFTGALFSL